MPWLGRRSHSELMLRSSLADADSDVARDSDWRRCNNATTVDDTRCFDLNVSTVRVNANHYRADFNVGDLGSDDNAGIVIVYNVCSWCEVWERMGS